MDKNRETEGMKETVQTYDGRLQNINSLKSIEDVIQLVQMADGTLKPPEKLKIGDEIITINNGKISHEVIKKFRNIKSSELFYIKTKNGFRVISPAGTNLIITKNAQISELKVDDVKDNSFIGLPNHYETVNETIKFNSWLWNEYYVTGVKKWYLKNLDIIMKERGLLVKDVAKIMNVDYWSVRRNPATKKSISLSLIKKFIEVFFDNGILTEILYNARFKGGKSAYKSVKLPLEYTEDIAYLDSYIRADGHIDKERKEIFLESTNKGFENEFINIINKAHDYQPDGKIMKYLPQALAIFYNETIEIPIGAKAKTIPYSVLSLKSRDSILKESLRSMIDTEGSITISKTSIFINITSSSFRLILGSITALLRLGIITRIHKSKKDSTWNLSITGSDVVKLAKEIKFLRHPTKNFSIQKLKRMDMSNIDIIPDVGKIIKRKRKEICIGTKGLARKLGYSDFRPQELRGNFSKETLYKINSILKSPEIDYILSRDLYWKPIKYVKKIKINARSNIPETKGYFLLNHIPIKVGK